jgi:hypothetical protein
MQFHLLCGSCLECEIKFAAMDSPNLTFHLISERQYALFTLVHILTLYRPLDGADFMVIYNIFYTSELTDGK